MTVCCCSRPLRSAICKGAASACAWGGAVPWGCFSVLLRLPLHHMCVQQLQSQVGLAGMSKGHSFVYIQIPSGFAEGVCAAQPCHGYVFLLIRACLGDATGTRRVISLFSCYVQAGDVAGSRRRRPQAPDIAMLTRSTMYHGAALGLFGCEVAACVCAAAGC
jgi:hypothetical protein